MHVLFGALVLLAALLLAPGLAVGPSLDAAVFAGVAKRMLDGDALYIDAWDHKPPGGYLILAAAQAALPWLSPWTVSWFVTVAATAGMGLGIAAALQNLGIQRWARWVAAGAAVAFAAQYLTALGGGLTEPLAAVAAVWALVLGLAPQQTALRQVAAGSLLGIAVLISFQLAPSVVALGALCVASAATRSRMPALLGLVVGAAIPWVMTGLGLLAAGVLPAAVDAVIGYGAAYRASSAAYGAELSRAPAAWTFLSSLMLVAPASLGVLALFRSSPQRLRVVYAMLGWIALAIAAFAYQGRFIAHYAIPLAIPLGVLAGAGLDAAASRWERATSAARLALVVSGGLALATSVLAGVAGGRYELTANQVHGDQIAAAAQDIQVLSQPDDEILVWGNRPELYLAAERRPAIRYAFMYPLSTPGYVTTELVQQVQTDLMKDPPLLVVDAGSAEPGSPGFLPLLIDRPVAAEGREVDMVEPLRDFIGAQYELVGERAGWPIYRLRTAGGSY